MPFLQSLTCTELQCRSTCRVFDVTHTRTVQPAYLRGDTHVQCKRTPPAHLSTVPSSINVSIEASGSCAMVARLTSMASYVSPVVRQVDTHDPIVSAGELAYERMKARASSESTGFSRMAPSCTTTCVRNTAFGTGTALGSAAQCGESGQAGIVCPRSPLPHEASVLASRLVTSLVSNVLSGPQCIEIQWQP